ncbi:DNA-binding MarR family transcriptional regulator [Nakamurella sp. UYEF19]|uniref:MarR family winged helix-turn-helix transcriptional regulator n=1 Tax=Nakamurella sp. UYEF19 TaxID=1756392 RepID=UPI003396D6AA
MDLRQVFDDLVRFETVLWAEVDRRLRAECGLTLGNLNVMMVIDSTPLCRVYDVAAALAITVGGTSQAIDRLQASGWCERRPNPEDRRSSILELTDAGDALLAAAGPVFDSGLERFLSAPLSATGLRDLAAALGKVRRAAVSDHPGAGEPVAG